MGNLSDQEKRILAFIELQIGRGATNMSNYEKIARLKARFKRMFILMGVNFGVVLFFGYSFYYDITQLSQTVFNIIIIVFTVNLIFLILQWKKLKEAINWLEKGN